MVFLSSSRFFIETLSSQSPKFFYGTSESYCNLFREQAIYALQKQRRVQTINFKEHRAILTLGTRSKNSFVWTLTRIVDYAEVFQMSGFLSSYINLSNFL